MALTKVPRTGADRTISSRTGVGSSQDLNPFHELSGFGRRKVDVPVCAIPVGNANREAAAAALRYNPECLSASRGDLRRR
jgi:hypothetical protein